MKVYHVNPKDKISSALLKLKKSGARCLIVSRNGKFLGTLSDGDIRNKIPNLDRSDRITKYYNKRAKYILEKKLNKKILDLYFIKKLLDLVPICDNKKNILRIILRSDYIENPGKFLNDSNKINVPVLIMSGGLGSRLRPITNIIPKPLLPLGKWTVLEEIINRFKLNGFENIYLSINYYSDLIVTYINQKRIGYIKFIKEKKQLGTFGAVSLLEKKYKNILITNCDVLLSIDIKKFFNFHKKNNNDLTLVVVNKFFSIPFGVCNLEKKNLKSIVEKPNYKFKVNAGMYLIKDTVFKLLKKNQKLDFDKLFIKVKKKKLKIGAYIVSDKKWNDTGTFNNLEKALSKEV